MSALLSVTDRRLSPKLYQNHAILWCSVNGPKVIEGTRPYLLAFIIDQLDCSFDEARHAYKDLAVR